MFWNKDKQQNSKKGAKQKSQVSDVGNQVVGQGNAKTSPRDDIRAQALANTRAARENLGDETIQKISEIMKKMENSPMAKAQKQLATVDTDRVLDELKWMLDNKNA